MIVWIKAPSSSRRKIKSYIHNSSSLPFNYNKEYKQGSKPSTFAWLVFHMFRSFSNTIIYEGNKEFYIYNGSVHLTKAYRLRWSLFLLWLSELKKTVAVYWICSLYFIFSGISLRRRTAMKYCCHHVLLNETISLYGIGFRI